MATALKSSHGSFSFASKLESVMLCFWRWALSIAVGNGFCISHNSHYPNFHCKITRVFDFTNCLAAESFIFLFSFSCNVLEVIYEMGQ